MILGIVWRLKNAHNLLIFILTKNTKPKTCIFFLELKKFPIPNIGVINYQ